MNFSGLKRIVCGFIFFLYKNKTLFLNSIRVIRSFLGRFVLCCLFLETFNPTGYLCATGPGSGLWREEMESALAFDSGKQ